MLESGKMKYVEAHRAVESHAECILFLYLQDVQGVPVANVKMKVWAGPPPNGQPPYFVDDDPDNPNRLTDGSGKFQFIVANPAPSDPLDFYIQVVGAGGVPQSDPVHFPFPQNEARWVTVTLVQEASTGVGESEGEGIAQMPPTPPSVGTVEGRVKNAPTGAQITLIGEGVTLNSSLGGDGSYAFKDVSAGKYSLLLAGSGILKSGIVVESTNTVIFDYQVPTKPAPSQKLFAHYLLFGPGSQPGTLTNLIIALDYILRYAPLVGFSPEEAKNAQHVTIVGDTSAVTTAAEQSLLEAGCMVARLAASDSYALESVFKQLIDSGSPHPTR